MKKILLTLFTFTMLISPVFSQEQLNDTSVEPVEEKTQVEDEKTNSTTSINKYFELELKRGTQNPLTKTIPFTVYVTPKINSSKTQILWNVPAVFDVERKHSEFVSLTKGQTYSFSASLTPQKSGSYEVSVNVISWQTDSNKANSADYKLVIDKSLTVQPVDTMYTVYIILFIVGVIGVFVLLFFLIKKGANVLTKKAKSWLTPHY